MFSKLSFIRRRQRSFTRLTSGEGSKRFFVGSGEGTIQFLIIFSKPKPSFMHGRRTNALLVAERGKEMVSSIFWKQSLPADLLHRVLTFFQLMK